MVERLLRTIRLSILKYCKRKNTADFIHDLYKITLIYNQCHHRSLSNPSPLEVRRGDYDTLDIFFKTIIDNETTVSTSGQ